jgi:alpha-L-fucosidase
MNPLRSLIAILAITTMNHANSLPIDLEPTVLVDTTAEPVAPGAFEPTWKSLQQYLSAPEWFRDAKFGIWAHWGPQCEPESGDWYARGMYEQGGSKYKAHVARYGHPSKFGFKDVINEWKAENWRPDELVALYKRAGAQYFFAMANHHDNFDLWDSKHHAWNSVRVGPRKDIIAGWAKAARENGLKFGVSVHASHAWTWYELSQSADKNGPLTGVPYDGKLTKADGKGFWWEGLDPQELYAQNHAPSRGFPNAGAIHAQWGWLNGASQPDQAYCERFYNRTVDLINQHQPDLLYFDDTALPLWPASDSGLKIAAHFYNDSMRRNGGEQRGVLFGKILTEDQLKTMTWDIERGVPATSLPYPWQTDTCIGSWHYERGVYERNGYKSPTTVIHMLADIVSKNGNLLLSVPVRGDGSIDEKEVAVLAGITAWMDVNRECIFGTRPWKVFGEGPASDGAPISAQGFNEGKGRPFTAGDVRFTAKGDAVYAIVLGRPGDAVRVQSFGRSAKLLDRPIVRVEQLGAGEVVWLQEDGALAITPAAGRGAIADCAVFKLTLK